MGAEESKPLQKNGFFREFPEQYKLSRTINNLVYGQGQLFVKQNPEVFILEKTIQQSGNNPLWRPSKLEFQGLVDCVGLKQFSNDEVLCGEVQTQKAYFSFYQKNLEQELFKRIQNHQFFKEEEIWYLFYNLVRICAYLQRNNAVHSDIRPQTILFNDKSQVMIAPLGTFPGDISGFQKAMSRKEKVYLSPEALLNLQEKEKNSNYDAIKNDVFSLGVTMLECMSLKNGGEFYSFQTLSLNEDMIRNNLEGSMQIYSALLVRTIAKLFAKTPEKRPDFEQLLKVWEPYETKILTFQPFTLDLDQVKSRVDDQKIIEHYSPLAVSKVQQPQAKEVLVVNQDGLLTPILYQTHAVNDQQVSKHQYQVVSEEKNQPGNGIVYMVQPFAGNSPQKVLVTQNIAQEEPVQESYQVLTDPKPQPQPVQVLLQQQPMIYYPNYPGMQYSSVMYTK